MIALKLEDKDIAKFKDIFIKIDKDGDGMVNCDEFSQCSLFFICSIRRVSEIQEFEY